MNTMRDGAEVARQPHKLKVEGSIPSPANSLSLLDSAPKSKRYVTTYLPGDVINAKDGSIALITQAQAITRKGEHIEWNVLWGREDGAPPEIEFENYAVQVIPGYPCSKLAWWTLNEFANVLKGPMHQVLGGDQYSKPAPVEVEQKSIRPPSSIAPFGRGAQTIKVTRQTLNWNK